MNDAAADERSIRVLIVDDQKVIRDGLSMMLGMLEGVEVVGTAVDGADALTRVNDAQPDVVLMDLKMPGIDGVEATRRITAGRSSARVVALTTYSDDTWVFNALRAGARGYLTKNASADEIESAIRTVASGNAQLDASVQSRLLDELALGARAGGAVEREPADPPDGITVREAEVLVEVAAGSSNGEIASALVVSEATVKTHINHLLAKSKCRDRAQLVAYAYRSGMAIPPRPPR